MDRQHRAEDLLLGDRHVRVDVGEHGRADEVAALEALGRLGAAGDQARALLDALLDVAAHALALGVGDERAEPGRVVERVAEREARPPPAASASASASRCARDQHPGQRGAGLAGVEEALGDAVPDRLVEVGVVEDHVGRLAAELQRHPLDRRRGQLGDPPAGPGRAGERDHVDVGVGGDRLADDRAGAGDQVEDARRAGPPRRSTSASMKAFSGATSLGLSTTVQPAARAGATLAAIWCSG